MITCFGYALMDIFEIISWTWTALVKEKDEMEDVKNPFTVKRRTDKALMKDKWKKKERRNGRWLRGKGEKENRLISSALPRLRRG